MSEDTITTALRIAKRTAARRKANAARLRAIESELVYRFSKLFVTAAEIFPNNWRDYPAPDTLKKIGTDWLRGLKSLALIVPSAVNPLERNVLINPAHPEARQLNVETGQPFRFDPRMFGK